MSSKKSKMGKVLEHVQKEMHSGVKKPRKPQKFPISPLDVSSIEKVGCFEDEEFLSFGNPLHSTALEDDFSPNQGQKVAGAEGGGASRAEMPQSSRGVDKRPTPGRARATATKSPAPKGGQLRGQRKSLGVKSGSRALPRVSEGPESDAAAGRRRPSSSSGKQIPPVSGEESADDSDSASSSPAAQEPPPKRAKGFRGQAAPALPKKKRSIEPEGPVSSLGQETGRSRGSGSDASGSSMAGKQPASANAAAVRRGRDSSLSSEELTDEDTSWCNQPGRKSSGPQACERRKPIPGAQKRKPSSGSSGDARPSSKNKRRERDVRNPIDLDVVLDAFLDFVLHYKETVEWGPAKRAIDAVSDMFEGQLTELITNTKELNSLRRENIKVNGTMNKKRARLLEIKSELITKETELRNLQKEQGQLQERLTDLTKGTAFLSALKDLHRKYLAHRQRHPTEEEVYGPSSMPALLLEVRGVLGAADQLKSINESLQQALDQASVAPSLLPSVWPLQHAGPAAGGPWGAGGRAPAEEHQREPAAGPGPGQSALSSPAGPPL